MEIIVIIAAVAVFGFVAYKFGEMRKQSNRPVKTSKGKVIVVDHTEPDTSKEDKIADKFGDLK